MTDLSEINYRNLKRQFFDLSGAKAAARRIESATIARKARDLKFLLRHHDEEEEGIADGETWKRDEVDELMHFYSVMEIAALLNVIPDPLPEGLLKIAVRHLRQPAVNNYFVSNYPLVLPQLFLLRVAGYASLKANADDTTFPLFVQLLQLDSMIHGGDENVDTLLWFLDGGSIEDYDIDDTIEALKHPQTFFRILNTPPDEMTARDSSVHGLVTFLDFCRELDAFLTTPSMPPLLRYETWHLYGYWFGNLSAVVGSHMNSVIERVANWKAVSGPNNRKDKKEAVKELQNAIERLVSGEHGRLPIRSDAKQTQSDVAILRA
jgi:hypothetical protein